MGYRSTLWIGYHLQRQPGPPAYVLVLFLTVSLSFLCLFRPDPFSVSRFSPRAKLLMNIGPKYQSTGIRRGVRRCSSVHMSVYYGGLHSPVPLVVTSHEGPPLSPVRVHGHARLSRVNSSSFSDYYLVTLVQLVRSFVRSPFPPRIPILSMKTHRATPYVRSHHPGVKTRLRGLTTSPRMKI